MTDKVTKLSVAGLNEVAETLLLTLYFRAEESQRPDAILKDAAAAEIARRLDYDFTRFKRNTLTNVTALLRAREIDRLTLGFLAAYPAAVVVELGCGLDTRFYRVDNGQVTWYSLDFPEVIALRAKLLEEPPRCFTIANNVLNFIWMDALSVYAGRPILFLAEGVFPYLAPDEVKRLVQELRGRFPGAELVFDAVPPFAVWLTNYHTALRDLRARLRWSLKNSHELADWSPGIKLLSEWFYFERPEPRLGWRQAIMKLPPFRRGYKVVRYRLGE